MSTLIITGGRTDDNAAGYLAARAGALPQTGPKAAGRNVLLDCGNKFILVIKMSIGSGIADATFQGNFAEG